MKKNFKKIIAGVLAVALTITGLTVNWCRGSEVEASETSTSVEPVTLEGFTHVTISDFGNNSIPSLADKTYVNGDSVESWLTSGAGTLNNTMVSMRVTFGKGKDASASPSSLGDTGFHIAGKANGGGLVVFVSADGQTLCLQEAVESTSQTVSGKYRNRIEYSAETAGVETFLNKEFLLQMSFEYTDAGTGHPGDNADISETALYDVKIGMYINGKLYNNQKTEITKCRQDKLGAHLDLRLNAATSSMTLTSVTAKTMSELTHVTLSDFGNNSLPSLTDKTYVNGESVESWLTSGTGTLNNTMVSMRVTFGKGKDASASASSLGDTGFHIAGKANGGGLVVFVSADGQTLCLQEAVESTSQTVSGKYRNRIEYSAETAGVETFLNKEFLLQMSFEYTDAGTGHPGDNTEIAETALYDVKIGMYFNGKLYNNQKTEITKCRQDKLGAHLDLRLNAATSSVTLTSVTAKPAPVYVDGFNHVSISDFGNNSLPSLTDKTYVNGESVESWLTSGAGTLNNTMVSMRVTFEKGKDASASASSLGDTGFHIAGKANGGGLVVFVSADGQTLCLQEAVESTSQTVSGKYRNRIEYSAETAGVETFLNKEFLLQMSFEYTDAGTGHPGDNTEIAETALYDVKIGMYFNGKLYNNQETEITKCRQDKLGAHLDLRLNASTSSLYLASVDAEVHHNLSDGAYSYVDGAMAVVNQNQRAGIYLDKPGDYNLAVGTAQTTQKVIAYVEGDVNLDGAVDVRDLVAGKKALKTAPDTKAAKLGMDMDRDDSLTTTDIRKMRTLLVTGANESIAYIGEGVMPIAGFWGPYTSQRAGVSDQLVSDEMFGKIADMGVNLISYTTLDYKSSPELVKKYLLLADKHNIGVFVTDSNVTGMADGTAVNKTAVAQALAMYRNYPAFCGMYLVDEPHTDYYGQNGSGVLVSQLGSLAKVLQKDFDLTCYANLFGMGSAKAVGENAYERYVQEFCETVRPKVLMWDYYVYSGNGTVSQYFENMSIIRKYAEQYNIPFWSFIQAGNDWNTDNSSTVGYKYSPNQSEFEWNVNTSLAFGAKGIQYFPLIQPGSFYEDCKDYKQNGLIGADGNTNQWYDYAKKINAQIGAIDEVLMNSVNKGIILGGSASAVSTEISDYLISSGSFGALQAVTGDCMVGCFDYQGKTALYVVNYSTTTKTDVTLTLKDAYTVTTVQNANSSSQKTNSITLNMAAGEGVLLVVQ